MRQSLRIYLRPGPAPTKESQRTRFVVALAVSTGMPLLYSRMPFHACGWSPAAQAWQLVQLCMSLGDAR